MKQPTLRHPLIYSSMLLATLLTGCAMSSSSGKSSTPTPSPATPSPKTVAACVNGQKVPIKVAKNNGAVLAVVPVYIDGHGPYTFVLDTGSARSSVNVKIAKNLGLKVTGQPKTVHGVGGSQQATPVRVQKWRVGSVKLNSSTITAINFSQGQPGRGLAGLLGSDVLHRFKVVAIEYSQHELILRR